MRQDFIKDKKAFFENLIDNGRLKVFYSEKSVEELISIINFLKLNDQNIRDDLYQIIRQFLRLSKRNTGSRQKNN